MERVLDPAFWPQHTVMHEFQFKAPKPRPNRPPNTVFTLGRIIAFFR